MKTNFIAWLQGAYIQSAIASVLSKNAKYPQSPLNLFDTNDYKEQVLNDNEEAIKRRSREIDILLDKNKKH